MYDGNNFEIRNLWINRPDEDAVGLFAAAYNLLNIRLKNVWVRGWDCVGGLTGLSGTVSNCSAIGDVEGNLWIGGLIGLLSTDDLVTNSSFEGRVGNEDGDGSYIGGLVGFSRGEIIDCRADARVVGDAVAGGVGRCFNA